MGQQEVTRSDWTGSWLLEFLHIYVTVRFHRTDLCYFILNSDVAVQLEGLPASVSGRKARFPDGAVSTPLKIAPKGVSILQL